MRLMKYYEKKEFESGEKLEVILGSLPEKYEEAVVEILGEKIVVSYSITRMVRGLTLK